MTLGGHLVVAHGAGFRLDLDVELRAGETVAVLGPNGAGKSTLAGVLSGLTALDDGVLRHDDVVLDDPAAGRFVPPHERRIGVMFQDHRLFDHLDVADNVAFGPRAAGVDRRTAAATAERLLDMVGLGGFSARRPAELSGGQAQRVALARALAAAPRALVLDEPLAALDVATRGVMRSVLADGLAEVPGPRVVITHDPVDAFVLADRVLVLEGGRLVQDATPTELRTAPRSTYAAEVAGTNLLTGHLDGSRFEPVGADLALVVAHGGGAGPATVTIPPAAVSLFRAEPEGSPRNTWRTSVARVEETGARRRVTLDAPLPISVDVTPASVDELALGPGVEVWASLKATEISVTPTGDAG